MLCLGVPVGMVGFPNFFCYTGTGVIVFFFLLLSLHVQYV